MVGNTETRLAPHAFYEPTLNRGIAIRELGVCGWVGVGPFNDFTDHLGKMGDLKHEKGMWDSILESKSLIRGKRMGEEFGWKSKNSRLFAR